MEEEGGKGEMKKRKGEQELRWRGDLGRKGRNSKGWRGERKGNSGETSRRRTWDDAGTNLHNFALNAKLTLYEESWDLKV